MHRGRVYPWVRFPFLAEDDERERDDEGGAVPLSHAFRLDRAAVQVHELLADREPEAHPAVLAMRRAVFLREPLEYVGQKGRRDSDSRVADTELDMRVHSLQQHRSEEHTSELQSPYVISY